MRIGIKTPSLDYLKARRSDLRACIRILFPSRAREEAGLHPFAASREPAPLQSRLGLSQRFSNNLQDRPCPGLQGLCCTGQTRASKGAWSEGVGQHAGSITWSGGRCNAGVPAVSQHTPHRWLRYLHAELLPRHLNEPTARPEIRLIPKLRGRTQHDAIEAFDHPPIQDSVPATSRPPGEPRQRAMLFIPADPTVKSRTVNIIDSGHRTDTVSLQYRLDRSLTHFMG